MAVTANLNGAATPILTGKESIVIVDNFQSKRGGTTLDVSAFKTANPNVLYLHAGHPLIIETATGNIKPMPIAVADTQPDAGGAVSTLPTGHTYYGILINTVPVALPFAGVLLRGTVNPNATPYVISSILSALKTALPLIDFRAD
jgi:hypothetical protein